jgi:hypothetical protein
VPAEGKADELAKCKVTLWYRDPEAHEIISHCGPVIGMNQLVSKAGVPDDEAFKKATTDGITKALSYLGFSADIFVGLYDDSKYVDRLRQGSAARPRRPAEAARDHHQGAGLAAHPEGPGRAHHHLEGAAARPSSSARRLRFREEPLRHAQAPVRARGRPAPDAAA